MIVDYTNVDAVNEYGAFSSVARALSSEVDTGSREENASKQESRASF